MPSGTLSAKIHGQVANDRITPPIVGPKAVPAATKIVFTDIARPSSVWEKSARLSVLTVTITADPPSPWITRMTTSISNDDASAHPIVASVNTNMPPR